MTKKSNFVIGSELGNIMLHKILADNNGIEQLMTAKH